MITIKKIVRVLILDEIIITNLPDLGSMEFRRDFMGHKNWDRANKTIPFS